MGPFRINKVVSPVAYQLALPAAWRIHDVFHASLLSPYHETQAHGPNFSQPPPDLIDGEEEYVVVWIAGQRYHGKSRSLQYLIKWKGYPKADNTWEPADQIHAPDLLKTYHRCNPLECIKEALLAQSSNSVLSPLPTSACLCFCSNFIVPTVLLPPRITMTSNSTSSSTPSNASTSALCVPNVYALVPDSTSISPIPTSLNPPVMNGNHTNLSRVKNQLSSLLSSHSVCMSLNCQDTTVHIVKLQPPVSSSGCMMINCPPHCTVQSCIQSHDGPCDCPTVRTDSTTNRASLQNPCPDLDPLSSTDSLQTHDSLVTPESPPHLPSPIGSLEEGRTNDSAEMAQDTQVRMGSLAYDSLVTTLSRLSLEPRPDPLSDPHRIISDPYQISITTPHPLCPDLDPIGSSDRP